MTGMRMENADGKEFNMFFKPMCFPFIQVRSGWVGGRLPCDGVDVGGEPFQ